MKIKRFKELNEAGGSVPLLMFRLYDKTYGPTGNSKTLSVYLRPDNTIGYSFYGGWQDSGMKFAISNLQLKRSLPSTAKMFKNVKQLQDEITSILATGVGSHWIKNVEELNELPSAAKPTGLKGKVKNKIIAKLKYLSNLDNHFGHNEIEEAMKEIHDLLDENFPEIEEEIYL